MQKLLTRKIVFANRKGGCGKTTTAVNVAHALAMQNRRVLLVDVDPQAHATLSFGISPDEKRRNLFHLLKGDVSVLDIMLPTFSDNLFLIPASRDLIELEISLDTPSFNQTSLAEHLLTLQTESVKLDYIIIDPPPSVGILSINALVAAREVFIPMPMHFLAMEGLAEMMRMIYTINASWNSDLRLSGIIPTFLNPNTKIAKEITTDIQNTFGADKLYPGIRQNITLAEAPGYGKSVLAYAPKSIGSDDYKVLAQRIDCGQ
ncbi:MAG: ParA family protein [Desulfamplus sp.]|nr:ParA family protein [Desulfamplus sp.]